MDESSVPCAAPKTRQHRRWPGCSQPGQRRSIVQCSRRTAALRININDVDVWMLW